MPDDAVTENMSDVVNSSAEAMTPHTLVTEHHVRATLAADKGADAHLTAWKIVDFTKKGDNISCVVSSVEVKYELDGQSSEVVYVVKLNPCRSFDSMKEFTTTIFEKESKFYGNLAPDMNAILRAIGEKDLKLPRYIYSSLEKDKEIIFLEDLRALGFKMADSRQGLDKAHAILILQELGRLHAASILVQAKAPNEDIIARYPFLEHSWPYFLKREDTFMSIFESQVKSSKDLLVNYGGYDRATAWIDSILPKMADVMEEQLETGKYKVICHGDCWNSNLLFRYSDDGHPVEVMLLDLQLSCYASPSIDLNYLLYTSTTGDVRRPNLDTFISTYYNSFSSVMEAANHKPPFMQAELQQDFKDKKPHGAIFAMVLLSLVIMNPENPIDFGTGSDENLQDMLQEMNQKSMDQCDDSFVLRQRFLSMFDDMMESGVIP